MPQLSLASALAFLSRHRFMMALMTTAASEQIVITMVRVATSYRAVEFGVSLIIIGVITAGYALVPIFMGIKLGRYVDMGHDNRMARIGAALVIVSCIGFVVSTNWIGLLFANVASGVAHMALFISLQVMCARDDSPGAIVRTFGNLMVATAVGQGIGSGLISLLGGSASIADARPMFIVATLFACLSIVTAFLIPLSASAAGRVEQKHEQPAVPLLTILSTPGFAGLLFVAIISVVSADLLVIYLPLVGVERSIGVADIGAMLTLRAITSTLARVAFAKLHKLFGGNALLIVSTLTGALSLIVVALPISVLVMYAAIAVSGFALGIATTVSMATSMSVLSPDTRATGTSLRMIGNRMTQFGAPFLLGLVAAASGAGAIFAVLGASLLGCCAATWWRKPAPR